MIEGVVTQDDIKAAMDEWMESNMPPDGFHPSSYYLAMYPDTKPHKMASILSMMCDTGAAEKSKDKYRHGTSLVWHYKIVVS